MTGPFPRHRLRVEIAPDAWSSIGRLPSESFRRLRQQLELLTTESLKELSGGREEGAGPLPVTVSFDGITALCTYLPAEHVVTLERVDGSFLAGED